MSFGYTRALSTTTNADWIAAVAEVSRSGRDVEPSLRGGLRLGKHPRDVGITRCARFGAAVSLHSLR